MLQIKKRINLLVISSLLLGNLFIFAQKDMLSGFRYANEQAPSGKEWESPENLALNKEQPRAYFFSFENKESARKVLPENSAYWKSLDGTWKFNWVKHPDERPVDFYKPEFNVNGWENIPVPVSWNIHGIQKDGSLKYGVPIYVNQPVIFQHKVAVDDWRGGVMRTPPANWTTYEYRNEVGSFRRDFTVPQEWDGRQVFLSFDGVDSFFYLWINGQYVGFSKNSRNAARFDITRHLQKGNNTIAVEVYRSSDASFLEAQDMFRLPGIFRTVAIYSTPKTHIRDIQVIPAYKSGNGQLDVTVNLRNLNKKKVNISQYKVKYSLFENELYSDQNKYVTGYEMAFLPTKEKVQINPGKTYTGKKQELKFENIKPWSAETPNRYTLVVELLDKKGRVVETVSTYTGFRSVEIRDTKAEDDEFGLAGRYYYINDMVVKLKGVNRHETNPSTGKVVSRKQMEEEVMLMKRANINHVRNAHYPDDPYWYYLCDKYGIYLEDEANIESHQYYYGAASLSHPVEWKDAHVARVMEMVHSTINNPSVVIWSLGNEAGPGKNFVSAYDALKKVDVSRPVQYERNNDIVDMGSNQYPSIAWMQGAVKGNYNIKYPFHVSEYAHSMGNACGNLVDYWEAIESTNFFMGGAIWDWIDQSMYSYDPATGTKYLAYGGDFGDTPNDGQFVMNGLIFADMEPKPQYYEVKKVYQHIGLKAVDVERGEFEIFNKYYFKNLNDYEVKWAVYEDGKEVQSGRVDAGQILARQKKTVKLPYNYASLRKDAEHFVKFQFLLKNDEPWAKKGYVQAEEQIALKQAVRPSIAEVVKANTTKPTWKESADKTFIEVRGEEFIMNFDTKTGTIYNLTYGNQTVIADGSGPKLNALRAFVNNDNWLYESWYQNGLHNLQHKAQNYRVSQAPDGTVTVAFEVTSQAPNAARITGGWSSGKNKVEELTDTPFGANDFRFTTQQIFTVYTDGSVELQASITSNKPKLILPRLGYMMQVPQKYGNFTYYGRGPIDNYNDRKTGQFIEQFCSTPKDEFVNFPKPQDMGNHEEVRWAALTDNGGNGAVFVAQNVMSVSALQYSPLQLTLAPHIYELPKAKDTYLILDAGVTGLGGYSCGQGGPLEKDRILSDYHDFGFIIRPAGKNLAETANVSTAGEVPISIIRDAKGKVEIFASRNQQDIVYTLNKAKKESSYFMPLQLRDGGTVTAWFKGNPNTKTTAVFDKILTVQLEVVSASSVEPGSGDAAHLVDGDPTTIWHTMYSVTVAKHPHWVDFDMGNEKTLKGFTYLPRQNGTNGNVKDYTLQVSTDGKTWSEPVAKGTFDRSGNEKIVMLDKSVKARYVRFTALSEVTGADFAGGAEFGVIAE